MQNLRIYGFTARLSKVAESRIYEFTVLPPRPGHVRPKNLRIYGFTAAPRHRVPLKQKTRPSTPQLYVIIHASSSPADFGWSFIRRPRLFSILIRRRRSTMLADFRTIYQHICDSLATQIRSLTVASVFTASPSELLDAEN